MELAHSECLRLLMQRGFHSVHVENTLPSCLLFCKSGDLSLCLFSCFFLGMGDQRCLSHGDGSIRGCPGPILQPPGKGGSPHPKSCRTSCCSLPGIYSQMLDFQMLLSLLLLALSGLGVDPLGRQPGDPARKSSRRRRRRGSPPCTEP